MRALVIALGLGAILFASGCKTIPDTRTFKDATGGSTGSGGAGGAAGSGGSSGSGTCDRSSCPSEQVPGLTLTTCCATAGGTGCGLDLSPISSSLSGLCEALFQSGQTGQGCADHFFGGQTRTGCCRLGDSTCGIEMGPLGCVGTNDVGLGSSSCTVTCNSTPGASCSKDSDCCDLSPFKTGAACVSGTCSSYCGRNQDCPSGCCVLATANVLSTIESLGKGVCAPSGACSAGCRKADEVCDSDADCCAGTVCVGQFEGGPRLCRPSCTPGATGAEGGAACGTNEICIQDSTTLNFACARPEVGLCTNTCLTAGNGACEDGSGASGVQTCAYGSDCVDCGVHIGGNGVCLHTCATDGNGVCEDSGSGSKSNACPWGTDCADCGSRLLICTNTCPHANNGTCNYDDGTCALGTDCADCGLWFGGRGQNKCDGSTGSSCTGSKVVAAKYAGDGIKECCDCGWDALDCGMQFGTFCDATSISTCCNAAGDACGIANNGICDCGGWCGWETDCAYSGVSTAPTARCDGVFNVNCNFPQPTTYINNGTCQCQGTCSWETTCNSLGLVCTDSCVTAGNGLCEDGNPNSQASTCAYGTDCRDCGAEPGISP